MSSRRSHTWVLALHNGCAAGCMPWVVEGSRLEVQMESMNGQLRVCLVQPRKGRKAREHLQLRDIRRAFCCPRAGVSHVTLGRACQM